LDGRVLHIKSGKGQTIKPNQVLEIANEGMPRYRHPFEKGSLLVKFEIEFPETLPVNLVEQLATILPAKPKVVLPTQPPPKKKAAADDDEDDTNDTPMIEQVTLVEPRFEEQRGSHGDSQAYDEDEHGHGGHGRSCATQ
jgi:DnaJ-class molecular chaperone